MEGKEYSLIVSGRALDDLADTIEWYESQRAELGSGFLMAFDEAVAFLQKYPEIYQVVFMEYRRVSIKKFPYGIFFSLHEEKRAVTIVAVIHDRGVTTRTLATIKIE